MSDSHNTQDVQEIDISEQARIRRQKLLKLQEDEHNPFDMTEYPFTHLSNEISEGFDALEGEKAAIAGRIMSRRIMGKASFAHIQDVGGRIQVYMKLDELGEKAYAFFKELDIGDIIGVTGEVFRTSRGEVSIKAESFELLSKSLLPLPEKYHGLKDQDLRYRQRYLDLMLNGDVKETFITRSRVIKGIRNFLDKRDFLEVETPVLHIIDTGADARPFHTHHNTLDLPMFLRIELELYLKRLIVGGLDRVYEIGRIFRNEGMSVKHNPEFTMCELYQAYTDYNGMMELVEELYSTLALDIKGSMKFTYQGIELDFSPPWERLTMAGALLKHGGEDYYSWQDDSAAREIAKKHHADVPANATKGDVLAALFDELVEDKLVQPVFITDYPVEISPLAKRRKDNPMLTERFEFFIYGREGGNAFSELNDPIDQRARFEKQVAARVKQGINAKVDDDFINAIEYGLPPTGGLGFGVDRLVMLLTDSYSIRDVILFPTMKPV